MHINRSRISRLVSALAGAALAAGLAAAAATGAGVEPLVFSATVPPGASVSVAKTVHTPAISPVPDIYFLSDTTGSMQPAITNVQSNASTIMNSVSTAQPGAQFGAGNYKDFPFDPLDNPYAFQPNAPIGPSALAVAGINTWFADGGGDGPEGSLFALHKIATDPTIGWRPGSTRVLVWFGDAPAHDPVCTAISGLAAPLTTAGVAAELAAANIRVIAISLRTGGYLTGLNDNSALFESDYDAACGVPVGRTGQAAEIAAATGGLDLLAASPNDVSDAILGALLNLPVTVTPVPVCDPGLTATYDAATKTVTSGTDATFAERFDVDGGAAGGVTLHCVIDFRLNGVSRPGFQQTANITVPLAAADVGIVKTASPAYATRGGTITYRLAVTNNAADPAPDVVSTDVLPAGVTFVAADPGCTLAGGTVTCAFGTVPAHSTAVKTLTVLVTVAGPTVLKNTATVTSSLPDLDPSNNTSSASTQVTTACPASGKVNVRWHYKTASTSGSWSGTTSTSCTTGALSTSSQAMEGDLKLAPGTTLYTGYSFTLPGNKLSYLAIVLNPTVVLTVRCVSGAAPSSPTLTVAMPTQTYGGSKDDWVPSGSQSSPLVAQGSVAVPDLCAGGNVRLDKGGFFSAAIVFS